MHLSAFISKENSLLSFKLNATSFSMNFNEIQFKFKLNVTNLWKD